MSDEETRWFDDPDEQPDPSDADSRRPSGRRWLVFSLLIGISLAAGIAVFVLALRGFVGALRSPLPVSDESWCIWMVLIAMVVSGAGWVLRPSRRLTGGSFWGAAIVLALTTVIASPLVKAWFRRSADHGVVLFHSRCSDQHCRACIRSRLPAFSGEPEFCRL